MTYSVKMTNIDFTRCDSLVLEEEESVKIVHYKVNLHYAEELEYKVNLSKRGRVIGGMHLALVNGGANGTIIGLNKRIIYFNSDRKRVSIGIAGDPQLTCNRLYCGCSVVKSSHGWIKLLWPQEAQVKTQQNFILSVVQMQDNGIFVNVVAEQHGRTQMMMTVNGVRLPLVIKNGLMYLEHYYTTAKQMAEITREEFMTAKIDWNPRKLYDIKGASDLSIRQFPPTPIDAIDSFYNSQGDLRETKSGLKDDPVVSDSPKDPVGSDSPNENKSDLKVDPVISDSQKGPVVSDSKKENIGRKRVGYRSKPKKENKKKKGKWVTNKKLK